MRYCRRETFQGLITVLLFENLTLQANLFHVICHVLEIDCNSSLAQIGDLFGSYHRIVILKILFLMHLFLLLIHALLSLPLTDVYLWRRIRLVMVFVTTEIL